MRSRFWLGFVLVAAIAAGSIGLALVVHQRERDSFETSQRAEAERAAHQAQARAGLSVGQLASAAAFYRAERNLDRHEFEIVSHSLLGSGALRATAFIAAVPSPQRRRFERRRHLRILERGSLGQLRPEGAHAEYYPIAFAAASGVDVQMPLGYDVGTDRYRGSYLREARNTGKPTATPVMRLPVGGVGINVFRPVYRDGAPTATVAERRAALIGFAAGGFRVPDLAGAAAATLPGNVESSLLEDGQVVAGPELGRDGTAEARIRIADRTWVLVVKDPNDPGLALPLLIAVFGISLATLFGALVLIWSRGERMRELKRQASQDSLTGLKNRRRFEEELRAELARSHRYGEPGALLMLDVDRFKRVNDTVGHAGGDRVLADIAEILRARARETDAIARIGGDEFAVVLPSCGLAEARSVATEISEAIRERVAAENGLPPITASIGIAPFGAGQRLSCESVLARADSAMYAAKESGRDSVQTFPPAPNGAVRGGT